MFLFLEILTSVFGKFHNEVINLEKQLKGKINFGIDMLPSVLVKEKLPKAS